MSHFIGGKNNKYGHILFMFIVSQGFVYRCTYQELQSFLLHFRKSATIQMHLLRSNHADLLKILHQNCGTEIAR